MKVNIGPFNTELNSNLDLIQKQYYFFGYFSLQMKMREQKCWMVCYKVYVMQEIYLDNI